MSRDDFILSADEDTEASERALDAARHARTAEADRRAAEAGAVNRAARCVCGCSGINHLDVMTDAELTGAPRIPCAQPGCSCDDLAYVTGGR